MSFFQSDGFAGDLKEVKAQPSLSFLPKVKRLWKVEK